MNCKNESKHANKILKPQPLSLTSLSLSLTSHSSHLLHSPVILRMSESVCDVCVWVSVRERERERCKWEGVLKPSIQTKNSKIKTKPKTKNGFDCMQFWFDLICVYIDCSQLILKNSLLHLTLEMCILQCLHAIFCLFFVCFCLG